MLAERVANQFPIKQATRRIAIVAEAPGTSERAWTTCHACRHEFASEFRDQRGYHHLNYCPQCFGRTLQSTPKPLVGPSGWLLNKLLAQVGIEREACFVGNVCQVQPPGNDITRFKWDGDEIQSGLLQLSVDLAAFDPHFIICLGNTALRAVRGKGPGIDDYRGYFFESGFINNKRVNAISTYHPARLLRESGLTAYARHDLQRAAEASRMDKLQVPLRTIDINLSKEQILAKLAAIRTDRTYVDLDIEGGCGMGPACIGFATSPEYAFVVGFYGVDGESIWNEEDEVELVEAVAGVLSDPLVPKCIMNALYEGFVVPWTWGVLIRGVVDDNMLLHFESYCELEKSLEVQATFYTNQPYWKLHHKQVNGRYVPFHWDGRRATTAEWFTYNGTDCCVTAECRREAAKLLMPKQREHYAMNVKLLAPLLFMSLRGIRYDAAEAERRLAATTKRIYALQDRINRDAAASRPALKAFFEALVQPSNERLEGVGQQGEAVAGSVPRSLHAVGLVQILATAFCRARCTERQTVTETTYAPHFWNGKKWVKKGKRLSQEAVAAKVAEGWWQGTNAPGVEGASKPQWWLKPVTKEVERSCTVEVATYEDVKRFSKDSCKSACKQAIRIVDEFVAGRGTPALRGELATLLGISIKLNSTNQGGDAQDLLYNIWQQPKQFKRERGNKLTDKLATDMEALLNIWSKTKDRRVLWFLAWRRMDTRRETLGADCDADGRIRCGYNLVGTETARLSCYESPTGSGYNLQTVAERDRDLFLADEGCDFGSIDLRGADSWSVAARAALQGDTRMLDDLRAGRKIQTIVALCYQQGADVVNKLPADQLDKLCRAFDEKQFIYKGSKMVIYGSSYGMGAPTMANQLLERSYKDEGRPVWVEPKLCKAIQDKAFFVRYWGVPTWQRESLQKLKETGSFTTCAGHRRMFYGRKDDHKTLGEYLCEEAQFNTTYATKLGLLRLWTDPENRREDGSLRIEPLHSVHDSLNPMWRVEDREFAKRKILPEWFNNEIYVGAIKLVIPASGSYGANWKDADNKLT